jgi:hypothetical protein
MWSVDTSDDGVHWTPSCESFFNYEFADMLFNYIINFKTGPLWVGERGYVRLVDDETGAVHERARIANFLVDK